ncbi:MAG: TlpA family protein disulfide reductase [Ignavibacteria bacterium]|nr:TlpA family protein disulfide reductase [Ignavibacteria bacterium]
MKNRLLLILWLFLIPFMSVSAQYYTMKAPQPCTDFARLPILQGRPVKLIDLKGKVVVIGFWHSERIEDSRVKKFLLDLNQFQASQNKDVVVVGINYDINKVSHYLPEHIKSWGITYTILWDNASYGITGGFNISLSRPRDDFAVFVIDKKSKIRGYAQNTINIDEVAKACKKLLAE